MKWEGQFYRFDVFMAAGVCMEGFRLMDGLVFLCICCCTNRKNNGALLD